MAPMSPAADAPTARADKGSPPPPLGGASVMVGCGIGGVVSSCARGGWVERWSELVVREKEKAGSFSSHPAAPVPTHTGVAHAHALAYTLHT
jgi:hypothetical protein